MSRSPKVRIGTFNIPLDSAKLPNGHARAKIAAQQIHDANLAIVACQEMDRGFPNDTWYYARLLLTELRKLDKEWKIIKPKTRYNENVIFYRPSKAKLKRTLADLILRSEAGGRHATRATFKINGKTLAIRNVHLVQGASNDASRYTQARYLLKYCGKSTIILGDLNQPVPPLPFQKSYKSAKDSEKANNAEAGTYAKWGNKKITGQILDHILVPNGWTVNGYNVIGASGSILDQPRASDHLLVIASITMGK